MNKRKIVFSFLLIFIIVFSYGCFLEGRENKKDVIVDYNVNMQYDSLNLLSNEFLNDFNAITGAERNESNFGGVSVSDFQVFYYDGMVQQKWNWLFDLLLKNHVLNEENSEYRFVSQEHINEISELFNYENNNNYVNDSFIDNLLNNRLVLKMEIDSTISLKVDRLGYSFKGWSISKTKYQEIKTVTSGIKVIYAHYDINEYNINFFDDHGELKDLHMTYKAFEKVALPVVNNDGYTFVGWIGNGETLNTIEYMYSDINLYLKENSNEYNVRFFNGDVELTTLNYTYKTGNNGEKLILPEYSTKGYTYLGWKLNNDSTVYKDFYECCNSDLNFYLVLEKSEFEVKFYDEDTYLEDISYKYNKDNNGEKLLLPEYQVLGYDFIGWSLDNNQSKVYKDSYDCNNEDLVFYLVKDLKTFYVEFYNGTNKIESLSLSFTIKDEKVLPDYSVLGYTFKGWYLDSEFNNKIEKIEKGISNNVKVYLNQEVVKYNIKYYYGSNELTDYRQTYTVLDNVKLPNYTKEGYEFIGWYKNSALTIKAGDITVGSIGDLNLYLKVSAIKYDIKYYDGESEITTLRQNYTIEDEFSLQSYTVKGYKFNGWYSDSSLVNKEDKITKGTTGDKVFYLSKELIEYTVKFFDKATELTNLSLTYTVLDEVVLPSYSIIGYNVNGWYSDSSLVNKADKITKGTTGDKVFYLSKELIEYTVKFYDETTELTNLSLTYTVLDEVVLPSYSIIGYNVNGWYSDGSLVNKADKITKGTIGDKVFYLSKELIEYTVKFFDKATELTNLSLTYTVLDEVVLPSYSKENYIFDGWYADGDLTIRANDISKGTTGDKVYYAKIIDVNNNQLLVVLDEYQINDIITYEYKGNSYNFVYGKTAFNNISDAINAVNEGGIIYVLSGSYNEDLVISKKIALIGNNDNVNPNKGMRNSESVINGLISINSSGVTITGFNITSPINSEMDITDFTYKYNISSNLSFTSIANLIINHCSFDGASISIDTLTGIEIDNSVIKNTIKAVNIGNSYGQIIVLDNIFDTLTNAIFISNIKGASGEVNICNNQLLDITGIAIDLDDSESNSNMEFISVKINNNIFENVSKCLWYGAISTTKSTFNYNIINCIGAYVVKGSNSEGIDCSKNLYLSTYKSTLFNAAAINHSTYYSTIESYLEATGKLSVEYPDEVLELNQETAITVNYSGNGIISYQSSNVEIAIVDQNGIVSAVSPGEVVITVTLTTELGLCKYDVYLTVVNNIDGLNDLIEYLILGNNKEVYQGNVKYIGASSYTNYVYGSVNSYYPTSLPTIDNKKYQITSLDDYGGTRSGALEFIVIHDTGASYSWSDAKANSSYGLEVNSSSWHYTIDDGDTIYQLLDDSARAWHAGDGGYETVLYSTGIKVTDVNHRPTVTIGTDGYYYLDNVKSTLKVTTNLYSNTTPNSTSPLPTLGLATVIKNGYYYMPGVYYNSTYNSFAIRGGASSIGIETCVNDGSDLFKTWHITAKLTAKLLVKYNLTPDRVLFHNNFANKQCPNTMINANLVDEFLKMVYIEYYVAKNFSDYTITFESSNPELIDNNGRLLKSVKYTTHVPYKVTVSNGTVSESITLTATIKGTVK